MLRSSFLASAPSPLSHCILRHRASYYPRLSVASSYSPCRRSFQILAIETSCDDTCVAVLDLQANPQTPSCRVARLLCNERITSNNVRYGGIHPLRSLESHHANLAPLIQKALDKPDVHKPDLVAVTRGPGMRNHLQCGIEMAKGLAVAWGVPLVGVHHMQAHALAPRLQTCAISGKLDAISPTFPFLSLLVSGGHTLLAHSRSLTEHEILASTVDIAIGDCLDKIARLVLPAHVMSSADTVSYGSLLEAFAFGQEEARKNNATTLRSPQYDYDPALATDAVYGQRGHKNGYGWSLTTPYARKGEGRSRRNEFSFSGLVAQVERIVNYGVTHDTPREEPLPVSEARALAKASMEVAFEHLASRVCLFLESIENSGPSSMDFDITGSIPMENVDVKSPAIHRLVIGGGVAANAYLRHILKVYMAAHYDGRPIGVSAVDMKLCTDNAAMIAWTAAEMVGVTTAQTGFQLDPKKFKDGLSMRALRKWSLENLMTPEVEEAREVEEEKKRDERHTTREMETNKQTEEVKEAEGIEEAEEKSSEVDSIVGTRDIEVEARLGRIEEALKRMGVALQAVKPAINPSNVQHLAGKANGVSNTRGMNIEGLTRRQLQRRLEKMRKAGLAASLQAATQGPPPSDVETSLPTTMAVRRVARHPAIMERQTSTGSADRSHKTEFLDLRDGAAPALVNTSVGPTSSTSLKELIAGLQERSSIVN